VSIALFGLYQAVFMANAGGAWDNAKKIVETELKMKNTPLHAATVVATRGRPVQGHLVGGAQPVIKFTTLFGCWPVELAVSITRSQGTTVSLALAAAFLLGVDVLRASLVLRDAHRLGSTLSRFLPLKVGGPRARQFQPCGPTDIPR
jgi:Na+/H+-translocating membrane pyrophosphatase